LNGWDAVVSWLGTGLSPFREVSLLTVVTGALGVGDSRGHGGFAFDRLL
jgi:hypothetical protein